jgi:hypothetical protein
MRVARTDVSRLDALRELPDGSLRVDASPTRAGILEYSDGEGRTWREYRPADEAFAAESLASLRGVTVTKGHPAGLVTAETWKDVAKGHVGDDVRRDGGLVATSLVVRDAGAVAAVKAHELVELSAGYECDIDPTPGLTPDGERYDAIQRNVRFNHVALLPPGTGRAGPECALRLDGKATPAARVVRADAPVRTTNPTTAATPKDTGMKIKVRGREFRGDDAGEMKQAQDAVDELEKKDAESSGKHAELMTKIAELMALVAQLKAAAEAEEKDEAEGAPADGDDAMAPEVYDSITRVRAVGAKVLGADVKLDGKKPSEIKRAVLAKLAPSVKLDAFDAKAVGAMFEGVAATLASRNDSLARAHEIAAGGGDATTRADGTEPDADDAERRMRDRSANAWKKGKVQ